MPALVGTGSRTAKCGPLRNSGLRMSLAWSSGSSSNTASARRTSNGSGVCVRHGSVAPSRSTKHRVLVFMILNRALRYPILTKMGRLKIGCSRCKVEGLLVSPILYRPAGIASFEQLNLSRIQTVVRSDDLHFAGLHARRDDWARGLQTLCNITCVHTDSIVNVIPRLIFRFFDRG